MKYEITDHLSLAFFTLIKAIIAIVFQYITDSININFLLKYAKTELFKINKEIEHNIPSSSRMSTNELQMQNYSNNSIR